MTSASPAESSDQPDFETSAVPRPGKIQERNGPKVLTAAEARSISADPEAKTNAKHLFNIVNARIEREAKEGQRVLERPFDGLVRPATEEAKRAVLGRLKEHHGYTVDLEEGADLDEAVIRWG